VFGKIAWQGVYRNVKLTSNVGKVGAVNGLADPEGCHPSRFNLFVKCYYRRFLLTHVSKVVLC